MVCPKCGKNTPDNKDFCDHCGAALIGPQSIYLNEPNSSNKIDKNNISSITGIDINEISQSTSAFNDFNMSMQDIDGSKNKTEIKIKVDFKLILLFILILIIMALSIYIMKRPDDVSNTASSGSSNTEKCEDKVVTETKYIGHKVTTTNYTFTMPDGYEYNEHTNTGNVIIRGNGVEMIVYPTSTGRIDSITSGVVETKYKEYSDASIEETTLNQRKIYIVSYSTKGTYYFDFYYQFSGEKILYGQAKSSDKNKLTSTEVRNIISSFGIRQAYGNFNYDPSGFNQENVLSSLR